MSRKDQNTALIVGIFGCGFLLLLLGGGGYLFFSRSSIAASSGTSGVPVKSETGCSIVPGTLEDVDAESWRATLRVEVTDGWEVDEFLLSDVHVRVGRDQHAAKLTSAIPPTPIREGFDLVYRIVLPPAVEGEDRVPVLRLEVESRASERGLFGASAQSSSWTSFVIDEQGGVLRSR